MKEFIGVFDSGMGGVTVLADLIHSLPNENFIYFGDSLNAPYGVKELDEVVELTHSAIRHMMERGLKAVVIACNTATSASISKLRENFDIPIIGMEPAVKPALEAGTAGNIAVMATPMTLKLDKFNHLLNQLDSSSKIIKIPSPELVNFVERGIYQGKIVEDYIEDLFSPYFKKDIESIVLGCTHFLYIKETLKKIFGDNIKIYDGNLGTVNRVVQILDQLGLRESSQEKGELIIENSHSSKMIEQSFLLLKAYQEME